MTILAKVPEACDNTLLIAERADVQIELGKPSLPEFPVPDRFTGDTYEERALAFLRVPDHGGRAPRYGSPLPPEVVERLDYELGVIGNMGFAAYFLVVWDLIRFARESNIRVGPGRGSAAGCCVAYCLQIVDLDPIRYDLLFERFLNPGRKQMPDIDMDFDAALPGRRDALARRSTAATGWPRSSRSPPSRRGPPCATPPGCWASPTWWATASPRPCRPSSWLHAAAGVPQQDRGARGRLRRRRRAAHDARDGSRREEGHRRRARLRGPAAPGRHPCGGGRHLPRPAGLLPADPAQAGRRRVPDRRTHRDPVRNAVRRGPRTVEDGLPRLAQPLGDRALPRPDRSRLPASGPTSTASTWPTSRRSRCCGEPSRWASSSSKVAPCARRCAPGRDEVRRRGRPGGPLPARADGGQHGPRLPQLEERQEGTDVSAPGHRADPQDYGSGAVPRVGDAGRGEVRRLFPRGGGQSSQGVRQEDPGLDCRRARGKFPSPAASRRATARSWARSSSTSSSRSRTTRSTSRTPTATGWWPTRPPGSRRIIPWSTWRRC